jgi:hypothetical protein
MLARLRPYLLLFVALTVVYHANLRPVDSGDTLPASLIPLSIVVGHTIYLDRLVPWLNGHIWYSRSVIHPAAGHYFSAYPIGGPLLVSPLYLPLAFFGLRHWETPSLVMFARVAGKFAAAFVAALSAILLLLLLKRITTAPWAWCLTLVYALATETWSISSQALWQHGPGELGIIGCFYCIERWQEDRARNMWLWLCGLSATVAFASRPTNIALLPVLVAALFVAKAALRHQIRLLTVPLVGGLLLASYNWHVFHRLSGGYAALGANLSVLPVVAGLFLSPGRGLLIYTPVAIFAMCAFLPGAAAARLRHKVLFVAAAGALLLEAITIALIMAFSPSVVWWGGYCWGPRMLTELAPALIVLMAIGVPVLNRPWPRRAFAVLALYSVLIQAIGVFFYPNGHWDATPRSVDAEPARLWDWKDNPIARAASVGLFWEPYAIAGAAISGGLPAARLRMRQLNVNAYQEAEPGKAPRANPGLP